jgi:glycerol-3-phosphate dehydrogenase
LSSEVLNLLGLKRRASTENLPIGGGAGFPNNEAGQNAWAVEHANFVSVERAKQLLVRYGTSAIEVMAFIGSHGEDQPLKHCPGYSEAEIGYLVEEEGVVHLSDLVHRRTSLAFVGGMTAETVSELAALCAKLLGWSKDQIRAEIQSVGL